MDRFSHQGISYPRLQMKTSSAVQIAALTKSGLALAQKEVQSQPMSRRKHRLVIRVPRPISEP